MATNQVFAYDEDKVLSAACTAPATPASNDPVLIGQIPGVAITAERADGTTSVATDGVWRLTVKGETNADAASAVAVGDIIYYDAADTPVLNKDTTGVRFGYAVGSADGTDVTGEIIAANATAVIRVKVGY